MLIYVQILELLMSLCQKLDKEKEGKKSWDKEKEKWDMLTSQWSCGILGFPFRLK